jgi:hypothetical protein
MMHSFEAKNGAFFHFNPDMSGDVGITTRSGREIYIAGADLIEFYRHVESLKRKGDTVYNGESEFRLVGQSSTMSPGEGVIGSATCELPCGEVFDPALPTTIGEMPIRFTDLKGRIGPGAMTRLVCFSYASAWK